MAKAKGAPHKHDGDQYATILLELLQGDERSTAIVGGALVDDALEQMLRDHFLAAKIGDSTLAERLLQFNGPLGTFSARIDLCYALKFYGPDTYHDLDLIRKVRNHFAHRLLMPDAKKLMRKVSFTTQRIASLCNELRLSNKYFTEKPHGPREKYAQACLMTAVILVAPLRKPGSERVVLE